MSKPAHLSKEVGDQFGDKSIVANYCYRPQYTKSVIEALSTCIKNPKMDVLDIGSGTGEVSIPLSERGHVVVGVDPSAEMVSAAESKGPAVTFVNSYIEEFASNQKFDLFVAANSIHWPDWEVMFPLLKSLSKEKTKLAIVTGGDLIVSEIQELIVETVKSFSTTKDFKPYSVVDLLREQGYISNVEVLEIPVETITQNSKDYIFSFHARNGFSLDRMNADQAKSFDIEVSNILESAGFKNEVTGIVSFKVTVADIANP